MTEIWPPNLRAMVAADLDMVRSWRNDEQIRSHMYSPNPIGPEEHRNWFDRVSIELGRHLMIFEVDGRPVGVVNIGPKDRWGRASWGFYVAPESPKGIGRMLGEAALDYSFNQVGLRQLCGEVLASNPASIRFHLRLGFTQEGGPMETVLDDSRKVDVVKFSITAEQFRRREGE